MNGCRKRSILGWHWPLMALTIFAATACAQEEAASKSLARIVEDAFRSDLVPCRLCPEFRAFNQRHLVTAYEQHGVRDPAWDNDARAYLNEMVDYYASGKDFTRREKLIERGLSLVEQAGCRDPAVEYVLGTLYQDSRKLREAKAHLLKAAEGFQASTYPKTRHRLAAARLARLFRSYPMEDETQADLWTDRALAWMEDALKDGDYLPGDEWVSYRHLQAEWDDCYGRRQNELMNVLERAVGTNDWLYLTLLGEVEINRGWEARGVQFGYLVTPQGWTGLKEHLEKARAALVRAWQLKPSLPAPASSMISVVMGGGGAPEDTLQLWFERAIQDNGDYVVPYQKLSLALLPRWGGSLEAMYELAEACAKTRRYDTEIPYQAFELFQDMDRDADPGESAWLRPGGFELLAEMFEGYLAFSNSAQAANASLYLASAWKCRRYPEAVALIQRYDAILRPDTIRRYMDVSLDQIKAESFGRGGPLAAEIARVGNQISKDPAAAQPELDRLFENPAANTWTRMYLDHQQVVWTFQSKWASATNWIPVPMQADMNGWLIQRGKWSLEPDGALLGISAINGLRIVFDVPLDSRLEVRADIEFLDEPANREPNAGLFAGMTDDKPDRFIAAVVKLREARGTLSNGFRSEHQKVSAAVPARSIHRLLLQCWRGRATFWIDDVLVADNQPMENLGADEPIRFGVGGSYDDKGARIRIRNLEARPMPNYPSLSRPASGA